nr:metal-dependent phosphohydrolase [Bacillota bacterium]
MSNMTTKEERGAQGSARAKGIRQWWTYWRTRVWDPLEQLIRRPSSARRALLVVGLFLIMFTLAVANTVPDAIDWQVGDVATRDVVAPRDVVNRYRTELLREEAARQALREAELDPANWEINPAEALRSEERVAAIFAAFRDALSQESAVSAGGDPAAGGEGAEAPALDVDELVGRLADTAAELGLTLSPDALAMLAGMNARQLDELEAAARSVAVDIMQRRRIAEADLEREREAVALHPGIRDAAPGRRELLAAVVQAVIRPNLIPSPEKIERARQEAVRSVADVRIREGQIIIRRGDQVEQEHIMLLQDLGLLDGRPNYAFMAGMLVFLALLFAMVAVYLRQHRRKIFESDAQLALLGLVVILVTGLAKVGTFVAWEGTGFLVPVGLAGLLVTLLVDSQVAIVVTIMTSAVVAALFGLDGRVFLVALAGGLAAVYSVSKVSQRSDLTRAGFIVGGVAFLTMVTLGLLRSDTFLLQYSFLGLLNGVVSAVGTIGLLPYLETLFRITSSLRLLELSNPNHPLLRKLLMEAPGSYHHSILVGNLAEAAAEAIGADPLLVRVGAQYHDIGKTKRPYFFVENQFGGENPHDKISPTLSTLIIISHVKDGVELAKEYQLPPVIIDFIREHHGTDLVKYFYQKALENAQGEPVDERDFRYPGPKPQSKETALVMLADAVEAAVRSLARPTPGRIEGLVRRLIRERLESGQLDESDLTLRDLDKIADAFVRVLTGIFHQRIEYPDIKEQDLRKSMDPEARRA